MDKEQFFTLHRHWMWSNVIKTDFAMEIKKQLGGEDTPKAEIIMPDKYGAYMSIWYGLLFVVLEGLKEEKVIIPEIEDDIKHIYEPLRLYRNAVFHPQKKYWSPKLFKIMEDGNSVDKIWKVHKRLGEYFLEGINKMYGQNGQ
ncbi:MAG: hypothetical protein PHS66_06930 [Candidatus Omnitrophica bacterium]|nr:hypothetical protein [Candidatus Omnitrophota bacterium]